MIIKVTETCKKLTMMGKNKEILPVVFGAMAGQKTNI